MAGLNIKIILLYLYCRLSCTDAIKTSADARIKNIFARLGNTTSKKSFAFTFLIFTIVEAL